VVPPPPEFTRGDSENCRQIVVPVGGSVLIRGWLERTDVQGNDRGRLRSTGYRGRSEASHHRVAKVDDPCT
jgi:hypothetical protein